MATNDKVTTYKLKQALAAKVSDHVEIAIEAEDGTKFKITATAEQLDALTGDFRDDPFRGRRRGVAVTRAHCSLTIRSPYKDHTDRCSTARSDAVTKLG